jgi:hypothetical protein
MNSFTFNKLFCSTVLKNYYIHPGTAFDLFLRSLTSLLVFDIQSQAYAPYAIARILV